MSNTAIISEIYRMYNSFAKRNIIVVIQEGAMRQLVQLYDAGYSFVASIVIGAFVKVQSDKGVTTTTSVSARLSGMETHFTVLCKLENNLFTIQSISQE